MDASGQSPGTSSEMTYTTVTSSGCLTFAHLSESEIWTVRVLSFDSSDLDATLINVAASS